MDGRFEQDEKTMEKLNRLLDKYPDYLREFSNSMTKSYNTRDSYIRSVVRFLNFLKENKFDIENVSIFKKIKPGTINNYMESIRTRKKKRGNTKSTSAAFQARELFALRRFFDFLKNNDIVKDNPCVNKSVEMPVVNMDTNVVCLTPLQIFRIKHNIWCGIEGESEHAQKAREDWRERDNAIMCLGFRAGLRVSAITGINVSDVDLDNNIIHVLEKENKVRDIIIDEDTADAIYGWTIYRNKLIKGWDMNTDALFISNRRNRMSQASVNSLMKKYSANCGISITSHKMRSTFATSIYEATGDIFSVQELLGHASADTTKRYVRVTEQRKRDALSKLPY